VNRQLLSDDALALGAKVEFLSRGSAYLQPVEAVIRRETHMSWVFLAGDRAYKLKKPVRFPYLDFSTLARREAACRAEANLNRKLAPGVYLGVVPLTMQAAGLALGGDGKIVDWLVVMRRLDESQTMERAIIERRVETHPLNELVTLLVQFYRRTAPVGISPAMYLADWHASLAYNHRILSKTSLGLPAGILARIESVQRRFLTRRRKLLSQRVRAHQIVDAHGDLRPEHIWLNRPVKIIDRLEFNPRLRAVDPFDEIAFLDVECERLGARRTGDAIRRRIARRLYPSACEELYFFYRCHRATLRARLAIAHLLEPSPRTPEKWPRLARTYLRLAVADAVKLERLLKRRRGRRVSRRCAAV
jgi:aminoglycoside phosphotransferase family enzyme